MTRPSIVHRIAGTTATAVLVGIGAVVVVDTVNPATSSASVHDAVIKNHRKSDRSLEVCRDWGDGHCKRSGNRYWTLAPGHDTKTDTGEKDFDGYHIPYPCSAVIDGRAHVSYGWHKIGGLGKHTIRINC